MAKQKEMPAHKVRIGNVTATVWKNDNFYSVNLGKAYKDGDEWKNTDSLNHGDLLNAAEALKRAEAWISEQ
jgi:hypothetical protein